MDILENFHAPCELRPTFNELGFNLVDISPESLQIIIHVILQVSFDHLRIVLQKVQSSLFAAPHELTFDVFVLFGKTLTKHTLKVLHILTDRF